VTSGSTTVLVLGGTGMLGHTLFERLSRRADLDVHATVRNGELLEARVEPDRHAAIHAGIDALRFETFERVVAEIRPAVIVNAIGIVRQVPAAADPLLSIAVNAIFPHRLARLCAATGARLIHIGTDCVFSGSRGNYSEDDPPDPIDLYGRSKLLGEPAVGTLTLRTSLIGHELGRGHGLLEWILARDGSATGFRRAIFSGLTTVELARVLADVVIPRPDLTGIHHLSSGPISKLELLRLVAGRYGTGADIRASDMPVIDRSLDSRRFKGATGYRPPSWPELVDAMYEDSIERYPVRVTAAC